jgi:HEAT repeat protein
VKVGNDANHDELPSMNMKTKEISPIVLAAAAAGSVISAQAQSASDLVERLKSKDEEVRGDAWQQAGPAGAAAIPLVATLWTDPDFEVARSAKRAVWNIVRHAGRPGAEKEAKAAEAALVRLTGHVSPAVRREAAWMISEIGGNNSLEALEKLLHDRDVRDDARCALERIPGNKAVKVLRSALETAPAEFRYALAESLRKRGEKVQGYPSRKLVPTKA